MLNKLSSVSVRESRIQYLCDPQWFRDTASSGPTTIVAPESQFRTCQSDHAHPKDGNARRNLLLNSAVTRSPYSSTQPPRLIGKERSSQEVSNATKNSNNEGRNQREIAIESDDLTLNTRVKTQNRSQRQNAKRRRRQPDLSAKRKQLSRPHATPKRRRIGTRSLKCTLSRSCMRFAYITSRLAYVIRSTAQLSNERYTLLTTDLLTSPSSAARSLATTQMRSPSSDAYVTPKSCLRITDSAYKNQFVVVSVQYGPFNPYIPIRSTTIGKSRVSKDPIAMHTSWISNSDIASVTSIGYPRMSASGESSTTMHRLLHASRSHQIPPPNDPKTNQYNQDLGLIHSTNGNHLESPNEGSSIDHQVTIYLHAQNIPYQ
ncbi:hypothetical protein F511_02151 [Dorcoceras hygrometricum]|uniref:Uncharacterized protein n=1 Tax=Dorcoceras hygrometricum TaxID=472368 RepID=A0A2Z7B8L3_9LAMI|nr:hypothetical protein F511_02151 [Dorcoceras hygrometricum]